MPYWETKRRLSLHGLIQAGRVACEHRHRADLTLRERKKRDRGGGVRLARVTSSASPAYLETRRKRSSFSTALIVCGGGSNYMSYASIDKSWVVG